MNITIICDVLGEANNGTSLAAFNLIRHLKSKGHNVTVVAPDAPDEEGFVSVPSLDLTFMLNWALRLNDVVLAKPDKQLLADAIRDADVVHLLVPLPLSVAAVKIAKEMDKPVTASFHCQAENVTAHFGLMDFSLANNATYEAFYKLVYQYCELRPLSHRDDSPHFRACGRAQDKCLCHIQRRQRFVCAPVSATA